MESGRLTFVYQADRCIGCGACQTACKSRNHLGPGEFFRRVVLVEIEGKEGPGLLRYSGSCNHCCAPACTESCPTGAMYTAADGTIQHDDGICIACGCCVRACPYGAPFISTSYGTARKCDLCSDLRAEGREPACVAACVTYALQLLEISEDRLSDPEEPPAYRNLLPLRTITRPSSLIIHREDTERRML